MKLALDKITINGRHRREMGDIASLAASIERLGLLHPVVVTSDHRLIAGERRIAAARKLGWKDIAVTVADSIDDALSLLTAERDENTCRKDFAPSEFVAVGEALEDIERPKAKERQGRPGKERSAKFAEHEKSETRQKVASALGISHTTYEKAKAVVEAAKSDSKHADLVTKMDESGKVSAAYGELIHRQSSDAAKRSGALPDATCRVIYADPPWSYGNSGLAEYGHAKTHYPPMSIAELCKMPVRAAADGDSVLFLWVTSPMLEDAFAVINAWGFSYKTSFVWDKVKHNFGHYNSVRHEFLLIATRGSCTPDSKKLVDSVQSIERSEKHSEKPAEFRRIIEGMYPNGKRIELFARSTAKGWDRWGDQS
jgi:N6-adenosine-specific RNA methylase IME4/ParB-like chromosome segregation protein Spo0J